MELSILVAKILSLAYLSVGVGALTGKVDFDKMIEEFERSAALTYLAGLMTLVLGVLLVEHHNLWVKDWRVLITLVGWLALAKGVMLIAFPKFISMFKGCYKSSRGLSLFIIALGVVFGYLGFVQ